MNKNIIRILKKLIPTSIVAAVLLVIFSFIQGMIAEQIGTAINEILVSVFAGALFLFAIAIHKKGEGFETIIPQVLFITAFFQAISLFNITFLTFAVETTYVGLAMAGAVVYLSDEIVSKFM